MVVDLVMIRPQPREGRNRDQQTAIGFQLALKDSQHGSIFFDMLQDIEEDNEIVSFVLNREIMRQGASLDGKSRSECSNIARPGIILDSVHLAERLQHREIAAAAAAGLENAKGAGAMS